MSGPFEDDDGIIDLRALASKPSSPPVMPALWSEPPPALALDADPELDDATPAMARKTKLFAAIGGAAAILVGGVVLAFALRGGDVPAPAAAAAAAAAVSPLPARTAVTVSDPPPAPSPSPSAAREAAPPPPATSEPATGATPAGKAKSKKSRGRASGGASKAAARTTEAAPKPSKSSDPCACHGDFQCSLRCAATK